MHGGAAAASVTARPVPTTARFSSTAVATAGPSTLVAGARVQQPVSAFTSVAAPVTGLPTATSTAAAASTWYPKPTADLLPGAGLEALHAALDAHMEKLQARLLAPTIATKPTSAVTTTAPTPPTAGASRQHPRVGTIAESGEAASQPIPGSPSEPSELPAQPSPAAATTAASPVAQRHHRRHVSTAPPPSLHISPTTSALPASPSPSTPSKWNEDEIRSLARSAFYRFLPMSNHSYPFVCLLYVVCINNVLTGTNFGFCRAKHRLTIRQHQ